MPFIFVSPPQSSTFSQVLHSEPHAQSSPNTSEYDKRLAGMQVQLRESIASYQAELLSAQTRLTELEGQVSSPAETLK